MLKYLSLVSRIFYLIIVLFALNMAESEFILLVIKLGGTTLLCINQISIMWFCNLFYSKKPITYMKVLSTLFVIFICLGVFVRIELLYFIIPLILIEILLIRKFEMILTTKSLIKHHDLMIILNLICLAFIASMTYNHTNMIVSYSFMLFILMSTLYQVYLIFQLGKRYVAERYKKLKKRKIVAYILTFICGIPLLFSFGLLESIIVLNIEMMIYSMFLMIYPLGMCRVFRIFYTRPEIFSDYRKRKNLFKKMYIIREVYSIRHPNKKQILKCISYI